MCGIAGILNFDNKPFDNNVIKNIASSIKHRGPDAEGIFVEDNCILIHKRLSIIDLSENANQPMMSKSERFVIVYNGEIYNYRQIAKEITNITGYQFKTNSDTEVVIEGFQLWGTKIVEKLNGMFAFAVYDRKNKKITMFRDRIGIKPLYYYFDNNIFAFASEIKCFKNITNINLEINSNIIKYFLYLGYCPEPETIYKHIKTLPPATIIEVDSSRNITQHQYWSVDKIVRPYTNVVSEEQYTQQLKELIYNSVEQHLISDVPFGIFLSGGTDSSIIAAVAAKVANTKINTFTIGFYENKYNEADYAKKVAKYINANHTEFILSENQIIDTIDTFFEIYDQPFADSSAIPTLIISKLAANNVKMILSGEGGDELFLGYGAYLWAKRLYNPFFTTFRKPISALFLTTPHNRYKRIAKLINYYDKQKISSHIFSQEQYYFTETEIKNILMPNYYKSPINNDIIYDYHQRKLSPVEQQALFDIKNYLPNDLLVKFDRATMYHSIEGRVPLLDTNIVEFAVNLPLNLKINNGITKYILKKILYQHIPPQYFDRPKWGFAIPLNKWLKGKLYGLIDNYLNKDIIEKYQIVDYNIVKTLINDYKNNSQKEFLYNRLWLLIVLHRWFDKNIK